MWRHLIYQMYFLSSMRGDFQLSSANVPLNEPLNVPFNADLNEIPTWRGLMSSYKSKNLCRKWYLIKRHGSIMWLAFFPNGMRVFWTTCIAISFLSFISFRPWIVSPCFLNLLHKNSENTENSGIFKSRIKLTFAKTIQGNTAVFQ